MTIVFFIASRFRIGVGARLYSNRLLWGGARQMLLQLLSPGRTGIQGYVRHPRDSILIMEVAGKPEDMNIAGFRFHALQGNPKRWSVRVTGNYRITFGWSGENALDVDFEDYH